MVNVRYMLCLPQDQAMRWRFRVSQSASKNPLLLVHTDRSAFAEEDFRRGTNQAATSQLLINRVTWRQSRNEVELLYYAWPPGFFSQAVHHNGCNGRVGEI